MSAPLEARMSPAEFVGWFAPYLVTEAGFTADNADAPTMGDYLADLETLVQRMLAEEHGATEAAL